MTPTSNDQVMIGFDEEYRIRVLEPERFKHTEELQHESIEFVTSMYFIQRFDS